MRRRQGDRGAASVEFALVLPVVLLLVGGLLFGGLFALSSAAGEYAAQQGLRFAAVPTAVGTRAVPPFGTVVPPRTVAVTDVCGAAAAALPDVISVSSSRCRTGGDFVVALCKPDCATGARFSVGQQVALVEGEALEVEVTWQPALLSEVADLGLGVFRPLTTVVRSGTGRVE